MLPQQWDSINFLWSSANVRSGWMNSFGVTFTYCDALWTFPPNWSMFLRYSWTQIGCGLDTRRKMIYQQRSFRNLKRANRLVSQQSRSSRSTSSEKTAWTMTTSLAKVRGTRPSRRVRKHIEAPMCWRESWRPVAFKNAAVMSPFASAPMTELFSVQLLWLPPEEKSADQRAFTSSSSGPLLVLLWLRCPR